MFERTLQPRLAHDLIKSPGILLLGPRQVGKTTCLDQLLKDLPHWTIKLQDYDVFQNYLKDSSLFKRQVLTRLDQASPKKPLRIFIDEVQKHPPLLEDCQWILDEHKDRVRLVATGSSARKLRRHGMNLLPGRVRLHHLHPLLWQEIGGYTRDLERDFCHTTLREPAWKAPKFPLEAGLIFGSLPGVLSEPESERGPLLTSYSSAYLREEIQAEAFSRALGKFARFLELAAEESGRTTNYQKLSQETGISVNTVKNYYSILSDTLVAWLLDPYTKNARRRLITTPKLYFFDVGVRNAAAGRPLSYDVLKTAEAGTLFEHWVVLEMLRRIDYAAPQARCYFWRTAAGQEVDLVIDTKKELIPIEIKWASHTRNLKLKGLRPFMEEYGCRQGYVIGRFPEPEKISDRITALPWWWI